MASNSQITDTDSGYAARIEYGFLGNPYSIWLSGYRLLIVFALLACLIYGPLYNAGFVTDFLGWLECRETTPFWQAYTCFNNRGLYFIPFAILEFLTGTFGLHPLPWFIVWTGMHAINAWLVADVCKRLFVSFRIAYHPIAPLFAGLIFLVHPWQVEVVAWKACVNYLASCMLMLLVLRNYLRYIAEGTQRYYWISIACFTLFLFTLEFALVFPAVLAIVFWCVNAELSFEKRLQRILVQMVPFLAAIGLWFVLNKFLFGLWIGHYGAETHAAIRPVAMNAVVVKYLVKTFAFTRFMPFDTQTYLYQLLDAQITGVIMSALVVGLLLLLLLRVKQMSPTLLLRTCLFLSAVICILPVTNLYFCYLQYSENDRYSYLSIAFLAIWLISFLWNWKGWRGKALLIVYLTACLWGTAVLVRIWEQSTRAYWHLIRTFPESQRQKVFLLNVPDNYKGTFMFRNIGEDSSFDEAYHYLGKSGYAGKMYDIFQYNMTARTNDVLVSWESSDKIRVEFAQWGNWWWRNGVGGERYSNEEYTAWPEGKHYYVEFKKPMDDVLILYHTPESWKILQPPGQY